MNKRGKSEIKSSQTPSLYRFGLYLCRLFPMHKHVQLLKSVNSSTSRLLSNVSFKKSIMYKRRLKITLVSKFWITIYLFFLAALGGSCSLSSRPGIKPGPAAVKAPCPNHLTASEFPIYHISKLILPYIFWHAIWKCNTHFVRLTFFFF